MTRPDIATRIGASILESLDWMGRYALHTGDVIRCLWTQKIKFRHVLEQMYRIGVMSLPIVFTTLMFVGMVFASQVSKEFIKVGAGKIIGAIVGFAIWRELGPLFAGVVVAARVGAAISTEIAAMKVTEQIDALRSMAISPFSHLYLPRLIALILMTPILIIFADAVGFISGMFIYKVLFHGNINAYMNSALHLLNSLDIYAGIIYKGPVFGFIIGSMATFIGSNTKAGASGIGWSATTTVVSILIALFIVNFFLSYIIF
jgi:phospholipid/cholesterol/gamma-HCH transport system permease protein